MGNYVAWQILPVYHRLSTVSCVESAHIKKIILPMAEAAEGPRNIHS